jgi:hypothetical protein
MCYQELKIVHEIHQYINDIHLYDPIYANISKNTALKHAIKEFVLYVRILNPKIKVYLHKKIDKNIKFDMICGIDMEYDLTHNYLLILGLGKQLSYNGKIIIGYYAKPDIYIRVYGLTSNIKSRRWLLPKFTYAWLNDKSYIRAMIKGKILNKKFQINHYNSIWTKNYLKSCTGDL